MRFRGIRRLFRPPSASDDVAVDEELQFHLDSRAADLAARGIPVDEARRIAAAEFGDVADYRNQTLNVDGQMRRQIRVREIVESIAADARYAMRGLRRSPLFTAAAVSCIALGIGVATTILSAADAILIRPLPYRDGDRLLAVYAQNVPRGYHGTNISYEDYLDWRDRNRTLSSLGMWTWSSHALSDGDAERVDGADVTANLFPTLGVEPAVGRNFTADEETRGRDHVVLLSDGLWRRRFGGDRGVVGRAITMDGQKYTVVGVMPPRFQFPERGDVWIPLSVKPNAANRGNRFYAGAIGRMRPGVSLGQAKADLAVVSTHLEREFPRDNLNWSAEPIPLRDDLMGDLRQPVLIFVVAVALVLLIACANVANLMLARGVARRRELAVRAALGAGRGRVARLLIAESMAIAALGGGIGIVASIWGIRLLRLSFPDSVPFYIALGLNASVLAAAALVTIATGLVFGAAPAIRAARLDVTASLRDARGGDGTRGVRLRASLVMSEVALSVILLIGAMLLIRSYRAYSTTDLGFTERGVLTARISLPPKQYADAARRSAFYDALIEHLRSLPGVVKVGAAQGIPFSGWNVQAEVSVEGQPPEPPGQELVAHYQRVTPDFFSAMGIPTVKGRAFTPADRDSVNPPLIVNETFVTRVLHGADPIGKRVKTGSAQGPDPWGTIVGVVRDFRHYRLPEPMGPAMYYPYAASPVYTQTLVVRTSVADPHDLVAELRSAVRALDPTIPVYDIKTMDEAVSRSFWRQRLNGQVLTAFAGLALLLAVVGIYGVISYAVTQRTREIGVRVALGASRGNVVRHVVAQGARMAIVGIVCGLLVAGVSSRALTSLLYQVNATDPFTFVIVPVVTGLAVLAASFIPALRATKVDPVTAMRAD